jgi:hypothetical protein
LLVVFPLIFLSIKLIEKLPSPSVNPANQALLSIEEKSKFKQLILQLLNLFNQSIALCNASILGVRI